ncbi:MAG: bifunctional 5,10-methylenetetrahydrofolate dehydrogenase/5,10-methenyltetrahydrofolate cyclohydrolase [Chloroflexi bacterium]|nr:bifunctional 5,10-methylenetetrahydrofolate dehydrogenase/5,10-methenyltetrahydrofolate cyclohydrolase [Chloroflexota bacterium]
MAAELLLGQPVADRIRAELAEELAGFKKEYGITPQIAIVQVGEDPAATAYVKRIGRPAPGAEMLSTLHQLPVQISEADFKGALVGLDQDERIHGIIVQMPLPPHLNQEMVTSVLSPAKDVDGIHPYNAGMLALGRPTFVPATPMGGLEILKRSGIELKGKEAAIVGRSNIVGKPMFFLLLQEHATVTVCHSRTRNLGEVTRRADVLVAAIGQPQMITADMVKPGAVVVDFGINVVEGKVVGDVDFEAAKEVASAITPVPGGTGPTTNAVLLRNTFTAAKRLVTRP